MVPPIGDSRATLCLDVSRAANCRPQPQHRRQRRPYASGEPSPRTIAQALPAGARRAVSQGAWLSAVEEHETTAQLRADAHHNLLTVARALAWTADWTTLTTRPTWERLCHVSGLGRRTVARWVAWLRSAGLLGVVESGSTPELRPMALAHLEGNRAALYVLAAPLRGGSVDETGTPSNLTEGESPNASAREATPTTSPLRGPGHRAAASGTNWGWTRATKRNRDRLGCAQRLQERVPALRGLSERHLRHLLRPWLLAGWTAADVLYAIDHTPDGSTHTWTTSVRSPKGWLRHRLDLWTAASGVPLPPLSATYAARAKQSRAEQAAQRRVSAEQRATVAAERSLGDRLRDLAAARWTQLVGTFGRGPRRQPGPMSEALARKAVLAVLGGDQAAASDAQLVAALDAALAEQEAAA